MGYLKYAEDNDEMNWIRKFENSPDYFLNKTVQPAVYKCLYCFKEFKSKKDLYDHIKSNHNKIETIVIINNQIAAQDTFYEEIESLVIINYNTEQHIKLMGKNIDILSEETDLTVSFIDLSHKNNVITLEIGNRVWKFIKINKKNIEKKKIEDIVFKWSEETAKGIHIKKNNDTSFNDLEKTCLNGFYNYFIACVSEDRDKKNRYAEAKSILSQFSNVLPLARFVLKIIAFKINSLQLLKSLCVEKDIFYSISLFLLNEKFEDFNKNDGQTIFVEENIEKMINIITMFCGDKRDYAIKYLNQFSYQDIINMDDINLKDKICLLKSRYYKEIGNIHEARRYYDEINSTQYKPEVEDFFNKFYRR